MTRACARVIRAYEAGEGTYNELAALFALGARTIQRWGVRRAGLALAHPVAPAAPADRGGAGRDLCGTVLGVQRLSTAT
jgi:hypothetical protein